MHSMQAASGSPSSSQAPATQLSPAAVSQAVPQAPQLAGSVWVSTQAVPHRVSLGPQVGSSMSQLALQPSPSVRLPSSHSSSQAAHVPTSWNSPSPQTGSIWQPTHHGTLLSHSSPGPVTPSPQGGGSPSHSLQVTGTLIEAEAP